MEPFELDLWPDGPTYTFKSGGEETWTDDFVMPREGPYDDLEALYISQIKKQKVPDFIRTLILHDHHDKVPNLRAQLMALYQDSDDSIRSIIKNEFPLLR